MASLVSVLMPTYRHEAFVRQAVESVLAQTHGELELIAIDDASPDGTWDVLSSIHDDRLRLFRHEANRGAHATLNEALARAAGDYVAILNSDDVYAPNRLERLLAAGVSPGLVFTDLAMIDQDGRRTEDHPRWTEYRTLRDRCSGLPAPAWFLAGNPAVSTSNFFCSRQLADSVGAFAPLRYAHDWDWALRAVSQGPAVWLREPLLDYRVHSANTLSEDDRWRHVHENSYVQARALLSLVRNPPAGDPLALAPDLARALLHNASMHPVSLLCFMTYGLAGVPEERLLAEAAGGDGWLLASLAKATGHPDALFASLRHWLDQGRTLEEQAAMLAERWQAIEHMSREIADRDRTITGQDAILAERDRCIASQAALIDERWNTIQHMSGEVANRDTHIANLERDLESLRGRVAALDRWWLVRLLSRLGRRGP